MSREKSAQDELLRACKCGDMRACARILCDNHAIITQAAAAITQDPAEAFELTIHTSIRFWAERKSIPLRMSLKTYLVDLVFRVNKEIKTMNDDRELVNE